MSKTNSVAGYTQKLSRAQCENLNLEFWYLIEFTDIFIKLLKYKGIPEYIPMDIVERNLFNEGRVLAFEKELDGMTILPTCAFSKFNDYGVPVEYQAISFNGKSYKRSITDSVLIKNSPLLSPCLPTVYEYCKDLANIRQAIKTNVNSTKTPFIFKGDKQQLLTMKNMYKQISQNEPVIYGETSSMPNFEAVNTQAPYVADKLDNLFMSTLSKVLTYLGINSNAIEKKERLTNDEVNSNNDFITAHLRARLDCRKEALEKINKMFGTNWSVEINEDYIKNELFDDLKNIMNNDNNEEGDDNATRDI